MAEKNTFTESGLNPDNFEIEVNGKIGLYVLKNSNNMEVCVTNFGGSFVYIMTWQGWCYEGYGFRF